MEYGGKERAGAVATPLCAAIQPPRPLLGTGVATARAFSDFELRRRYSQMQNRKQIELDIEEESLMPLISKK
jgi:hypothetical protein